MKMTDVQRLLAEGELPRRVFYQAVSAGLIEKTIEQYKRLADMRPSK